MNTKHLKPLYAWMGGKRKEIKKILQHIPDKYERYISPFFGGGALFWYLENDKNIINDIQYELICFLKQIQDNKNEDIIKFLEKVEISKEYYDEYKIKKYENEYEVGLQFYYTIIHAFGAIHRQNINGIITSSYNKKRVQTHNYFIKMLKNDRYTKLLKNTEIYNKDYKEIIKLGTENDFIFIDPPYYKTHGYNNNFGKKEQEELCELFKKSKSKCLLIINNDPFIRELYKDYIKEEYNYNYGVGNCKAHHLLIMNYNPNIP